MTPETQEIETAGIYAMQNAEIALAQKKIRERVEPWIEASIRHGLSIREGLPLASTIGEGYPNLRSILPRTLNYKLTDEMLERAIAENPGIDVKGFYQEALPSILKRTARGCTGTAFEEFISQIIKNFNKSGHIHINDLFF